MDYGISNTATARMATKEKTDDAITPYVSDGVVIEGAGLQDFEKQKTIEGETHFHRLGWRRLTVICIVQSIALGALGLPSAFANLGMVAGVILCIGMGFAAMYASYTLGQVKLKFPHVAHYVHIGTLVGGKVGTVIVSIFFVSLAVLAIGSHCLTGKIALVNITQSSACSLVFGVISAIILLVLAIPPSFTEIAILGYIDFASIMAAIGITIIATGIQSSGGATLGTAAWSAWPKEGLTFAESIVSLNNIVFAFGFASSQPSFMAEMHTPEDYTKSIWVLSVVEIITYTLTGALIYAFVGQDVQSPALLSAGTQISRVAFGVALPVIFISGSINTTAVCRYIHVQIYKDSVVQYVNTKKGWITWLGLISFVTLLAWIIAESIPFFSELLSIAACLFVSGLSFYFPPIMWYSLLKEGKWYDRNNLRVAIQNGTVFMIGIVVFVCGTYASVYELIKKFRDGSLGKPFACST